MADYVISVDIKQVEQFVVNTLFRLRKHRHTKVHQQITRHFSIYILRITAEQNGISAFGVNFIYEIYVPLSEQ